MARARKIQGSVGGGASPEMKTIGLIVAVAAVAIGYYATRDKGDEADKPTEGGEQAAVSQEGPYALEAGAYGPATAQAVLVKYTDFQ